MATIKSYTTIEQSKKLAETLPFESADGFYEAQHNPITNEWEDILFTGTKWASKDVVIPAWSLTALLDVLSFPQLSKDKLGSGKTGWMVSAYPNDCRYDSCWHDNPVDACYELILKLHELKML